MGDTTSLVPGFPIRTSSDPRSVDSSPRHNAASHVLHRLPVPRHPPCALTHLQHKKPEKNKKLHHNKPHTTCTQPRAETPRHAQASMRLDARNHYPQIKHHTPPPRWSDNTPPTPHRGQGKTGLLPQSPIVCPAAPGRGAKPRPRLPCSSRTHRTPTTGVRHDLPTTMNPTGVGMGEPLRYRCSLERR